MESLDLITSNPEEARTWITGLKYLMAGISDEDSLAKRQRTHDQYPFRKLDSGSVSGDSGWWRTCGPPNIIGWQLPLAPASLDDGSCHPETLGEPQPLAS